MVGIHIYRYGTFCAIAGVNQFDDLAAEYNLPGVDSINMAPLILGQTNESPRKNVKICIILRNL
jgi:arylsulfatase B